MKILLVGNRLDIFAKELGSELSEKGHDMCFLDTANLEILSWDREVLERQYALQFQRFRHIPKINVLVKLFLISKILNKSNFDVVNILGVGWHFVLLLLWIKRHIRIVLTFYGSDFYRSSRLAKTVLIPLYQRVYAITFTNPATKASFLKYYQRFEEKCHVCRFGLKTLDFIDKNRSTNHTEIQKHLGYDQNRIIVTCGYNATQAQQHETMIECMKRLPKKAQDAMQFVFPLTYGDSAHKEKVKAILHRSSLNYLVLEEFLYADENAYIKLASDIMINILQTDSFSGSMQEFLYAGNIVITGSWLPYALFDSSGIVYEKIDEPQALTSKLFECYERFEELRKKLWVNEAIIHELSSWSITSGQWLAVYTCVSAESGKGEK